MNRNVIVVSAIGVVTTAAILWFAVLDRASTGIACLANGDYAAAGIEPHPDQISDVETAWGEPIPRHLLLIGGLDGFDWALICRHEGDPEGVFRGEYRTFASAYEGTFRYEDREGRPLPERLFQDYYVSSYSPSLGMIVGPRDVSHEEWRRRWFLLVPDQPGAVRRPDGR